MIRNLEDTRGALMATQDSVLVSYRYDDEAETLTMVLSYLYQDAGATCAFLRLRFMDVSHFERGPEIPRMNQHIQESYSRGDTTGTYCVDLVHIGKKANVGSAEQRNTYRLLSRQSRQTGLRVPIHDRGDAQRTSIQDTSRRVGTPRLLRRRTHRFRRPLRMT